MNGRLERILEEGIARHARSEPLAGMDERILARIRMAGRPQRRWMDWRVAAAVGVAGMAVMLVLPRREVPQALPKLADSPPMVVRAEPHVAVLLQRRSHFIRGTAVPKLRLFPRTSPLTIEERRLIAMVKQDPEGTAEVFQSLQKRNELIEIAPLAIEPLESGAAQ